MTILGQFYIIIQAKRLEKAVYRKLIWGSRSKLIPCSKVIPREDNGFVTLVCAIQFTRRRRR